MKNHLRFFCIIKFYIYRVDVIQRILHKFRMVKWKN